MRKKMWQSLCRVTVAAMLVVTSFLCPVKADSKTLDDLWNMLYSIDQALTSASTQRSGDLIYKFEILKQDFEYIFGTSASGQGDGHINYVYNNQSISGSTFNQAMGDLISQQNEILMSLVSRYVDASDPDNVVVQPGLFDRLTTIYNAVSSSASSDATIASYIDDITSETQQIRSILSEMNTYNIPLESLLAYNYFIRFNGATISANSLTKYPMVTIKESVSSAYNAQRRIYIPSGQTLVIAFLMYTNDDINSSSFIPYALNDTQLANIQVTYDYIAVSNTRRMYHVIVKNNNSSGKASVSFDFTYSSKNIIPFYLGLESLMSDEMQSAIMYYRRESNYQLLTDIRDAMYNSEDGLSWLQKIYNHLVGDPDSTNQTQQDIDSMNQKVDQLQTSLDNYSDQLEDNLDDVNPNSVLQEVNNMSGKVGFMSNLIQEVYSSFGAYSWLFLMPLIFGIILLFMG